MMGGQQNENIPAMSPSCCLLQSKKFGHHGGWNRSEGKSCTTSLRKIMKQSIIRRRMLARSVGKQKSLQSKTDDYEPDPKISLLAVKLIRRTDITLHDAYNITTCTRTYYMSRIKYVGKEGKEQLSSSVEPTSPYNYLTTRGQEGGRREKDLSN